jgi:soluble lytic murein transglycosylase-like protein
MLFVVCLLVSAGEADPQSEHRGFPGGPEEGCLVQEVRRALREAPSRQPAPRALRTEELIVSRAPWLEGEAAALAERIVSLAARHGLEPELILAVIQVESNFHPTIRSRAGAVGLMQLLPSTGLEVAQRLGMPWRGHRTLRDPHRNVELGTAYLVELLERFEGDEALALAAYNQGPGRVERLMRKGRRVPLWYSFQVLRRYDEMRAGPRPAAG